MRVGVQFFSRLPVGNVRHYQSSYLTRSRAYFPWVGWLVALIMAAIAWIVYQGLSAEITIVLMMIAGVLATGAFHEDGFADCCDGFGGGWDKPQVLTIMKDSRLGTYATIGLILLFLLKFTLYWSILSHSLLLLCWLLWQSQSLSRYFASLIVDTHDYVQDIDQSKAKPIANQRLSAPRQLLALTAVLIPLLLAGYWQAWLAALLAGFMVVCLVRYSVRRIGGYTGDVLGAAQQLAEVGFLMGFLVLI